MVSPLSMKPLPVKVPDLRDLLPLLTETPAKVRQERSLSDTGFPRPPNESKTLKALLTVSRPEPIVPCEVFMILPSTFLTPLVYLSVYLLRIKAHSFISGLLLGIQPFNGAHSLP